MTKMRKWFRANFECHVKTERQGWSRRKQRYIGAVIGLKCPQIQLQITPLCWGLEFAIDRGSVGVRVGPLAVRVWAV